MIRRTRPIAGLFALLALTFSFAESVWASTCAMPIEGAMAAVETPATAPPRERSDCAAHFGDGSAPSGEDGEPCPFDSPVAAQACAGVASLPATTALLPALTSDGVADLCMPEVRPRLLLEASLFRPPRA